MTNSYFNVLSLKKSFMYAQAEIRLNFGKGILLLKLGSTRLDLVPLC